MAASRAAYNAGVSPEIVHSEPNIMVMRYVEGRTCSPEDLSRLDEAWPAPGKVHASHAAGQDSGDATYLVAWSGNESLGSLVVQWTGPHGDNARAAFPRAVTLSHLQVRPEHRGAGVGSALIAAGEEYVTTEAVVRAIEQQE